MGYPERSTEQNTGQLKAELFLDNPKELRNRLVETGTFTFRSFESGLFPASDLPDDLAEATTMGMAWFRDNAHVANALLECGHEADAASAGKAMLTILRNNTVTLNGIIDGSLDPSIPENRLPVRVDGDTLANDTETRVQNDSVGYPLWFISKLGNRGSLQLDKDDITTLAKVVKYLEKIEYWQDDQEQGHWEESLSLHAASIGVVVAGLTEAKQLFEKNDYSNCDFEIDQLIQKGVTSMNQIIDQDMVELTAQHDVPESEAPALPENIEINELVRTSMERFANVKARGREYDASMLFLIEPLGVLDETRAAKIISDIEQQLVREKGVIRYPGDTYWQPRFPSIYGLGERTTDTKKGIDRDRAAEGVYISEAEAQWTLFDPILSSYWGRLYQKTGDQAARKKQLHYLDRSLSQLTETPDGKLHLPEAYYFEFVDDTPNQTRSDLVPNEHTPLLWSQANLLNAVRIFEETEPEPSDIPK